MSELSEVRKQAWKTRRSKYGERGHAGSYWRGHTRTVPDQTGMLNLIIRLHAEEVLSEGQVARATGLDRVEVRRLLQESAA
jgi:hypothetical protein